MIETFNRYETLITVLSLALFVGGPTTVAAGLALRLAIRGGVTLARRAAVAATAGVVATAAAYYYIQGNDGGGGVALALPVAGVTASDLRRESLTFHFRDAGGGVPVFYRQDSTEPLERKDVLRELAVLSEWGNLRRVEIIDEFGRGGEVISSVESVAQNFSLDFSYERR